MTLQEKLFHNTVLQMSFLGIIYISGIISLFYIKTALMPDSQDKSITVEVDYPGQNSEKIEESIAVPAENIFRRVGGVKDLYTISKNGKCVIIADFYPNSDMSVKASDVKSCADELAAVLPEEVNEPSVYTGRQNDKPSMIISVTSKLTGQNLLNIVKNDLQPLLERVTGVAKTERGGFSEKEILIVPDKVLYESEMTLQDIINSIAVNHFVVSGGIHNDGTLWRLSQQVNSPEDIGDLFTHENSRNKIKDYCSIKINDKESEILSRKNGSRVNSIFVYKTGSFENISTSVIDVFKNFVEKNSNIHYEVVYDENVQMNNIITNALINLFCGICLSILIIVPFFAFRDLLIISVLYFAVLLSASLYFYINEISFNLLSVNGLIAVSGMTTGYAVLFISKLKVNEVKNNISIYYILKPQIMAATASMLTNIIVFIPMAFFTESSDFTDFPETVIFCSLISLLYVVIFLPPLYAKFSSGKNISANGGIIRKICKAAKLSNVNIIKNRDVDLLRSYARRIFLNKKFLPMMYVAVITAGIISYQNSEVSAASDIYNEELVFSIYFHPDLRITESEKKTMKYETRLLSMNGVESVSSAVRKGRADITVKLNNYNNANVRIIEKAIPIDLTDTIIFQKNTQSEKTVKLEVYGDNLADIRKSCEILSRGLLRSNSIRTVVYNYSDETRQILITPEFEKCRQSGLNPYNIFGAVHMNHYRPVIAKLYGANQSDVRIGDDSADRSTDLMDLIISTGDKAYRLKEFAKTEKVPYYSVINRKNKIRYEVITVIFDNDNIFGKHKIIKDLIGNVKVGENISVKIEGDDAKEKSGKLLLALVGFSGLMVFFLLCSLYESFTIPLLVMSVVPVSVAFSASVCFAAGFPVNASYQTGMLLLIGSCVNSVIILLDPEFRSRSKFFILMITTLTAVLPFIPNILFGNNAAFGRETGLIIASGLIISALYAQSLQYRMSK